MKEKLFICYTYYHTLITLIKAYISQEEYSVLLSNKLQRYDKLKNDLENTGRIKVIEYKENEISENRTRFKTKIGESLLTYRNVKLLVEKYCPINFRDYELYLYHDLSELGLYFVKEKIQYHLIEDALDYFQYFDKYYSISKGSYKKGTVKFFIKEKLNIGFCLWGSSPYCIDIEVNDINGIKISTDKVFEVSRVKLFNLLGAEQQKSVFAIFAENKQINTLDGKNAVVFTQPLFADRHVSSIDDQMLVFKSIVKEYKEKGYNIIIKVHPRDELDYNELCKEYDCFIIDRNIPSEVLNYEPNAKFDVAISVTSTSINFLKYADEKVFKGMDYVNDLVKRR